MEGVKLRDVPVRGAGDLSVGVTGRAAVVATRYRLK